MFYGPLKEEGDVQIEDVSAEAIKCLRKYGNGIFFLLIFHNIILGLLVIFRYIYTDSIDTVSLANVVDILAAAKKYMMAKLTRHCYGLIQNNITAENSVSLWSQVSLKHE